jgi:hypothetical protein
MIDFDLTGVCWRPIEVRNAAHEGNLRSVFLFEFDQAFFEICDKLPETSDFTFEPFDTDASCCFF